MLVSPVTVAAAGVSLLVAYLIVARIRDYVRIRHVPGPSLTAWTDFWLVKNTAGGELAFKLQHLNKKYGPLVRIAPNWVICGDGTELRRLWAVRSPWKRGQWYRGLRFDPYHDSAFTAVDDKVHDPLRSKLVNGYAGKDVEGLHEAIDEQVAGLVNLIETRYLSTETEFKPCDLARKVQYFTLDVISAIGFGKKFGYVEADADFMRYIDTTEKMLPTILMIALQPWVLSIMQNPTLSFLFPNVKSVIGIGDVMKRASEAVEERYGEKPVVKRDILGSFVAHGLTKQEAEGETTVQIFAGSDTTATVIRSTMLFIITNPHVYGRLRAEMDAAVREGRVSSPITDAEARRFDYLQAVIREGLRYWPPATGLLPKVSESDQTVCGVHIPAGTNVAWSPFAIMRNQEIFGHDADLFRPERWLEIPQEQYRLMESHVMLEFAGGSRWECLGKNIAMIELNKVYVEGAWENMSDFPRAPAQNIYSTDEAQMRRDNGDQLSGGDAPFRNAQPRADDRFSHGHRPEQAQNQSYLDQGILDSLLGLASGHAGSNGFGLQPRWPDDAVSGSVYPDIITEAPNQLWTDATANGQQETQERAMPWLGNDVYHDPYRAINDLQWPTPDPVTRHSDPSNWSQLLAGEDDPNTVLFRYQFLQQQPIMMRVPCSGGRIRPPHEEPVAMTAIFDALRSNALDGQPGTQRQVPAYSRANSGTSANSSGGSGSSLQSGNSAWSATSDMSRGRRAGFGTLGRTRQGRVGKKRGAVTRDPRPFKCTFCCDDFKTKYDWSRHEKSRHLSMDSAVDPSEEHLEEHNHATCHDRPKEARSFGRKDHLVQHLRVMHKLEKMPHFDDWRVEGEEMTSRCGFCNVTLASWSERVDHLAGHFRKGASMKEWKGEHDFSPVVAEQVVHALPPYLIASESSSVVPFSATKQSTKDHYAQISSRTRSHTATHETISTDVQVVAPTHSSSIVTSRAATSRAFTDILERHLKHFADEHIARGVDLTDEMLRQEARRVIYDSEDEWNQTVADNVEWLVQFRTRHGLTKGQTLDNGAR
ncbi:Cytochrome P450 monooxygenase lolP1 [Colletotrichum sidae]|uniref:Cytochrome P450 monooxygenase lolP1 n=1 Tax=Colletotrichum sidae TaxID=1347389 RepID=A0A4R8TLP1_9PEZI|nr:Cytochrome P450 monooxygenase lolP1 [Colletotrichum sidae]